MRLRFSTHAWQAYCPLLFLIRGMSVQSAPQMMQVFPSAIAETPLSIDPPC